MLHKLKFYGSIVTMYVMTFGAIGTLLYSSHLFETTADAARGSSPVVTRSFASAPRTIAGTPVRIAMPSYGIDLPVDIGRYDAKTKKWSLSDTRAQYAEMTAKANSHAGITFIYGHGTDAVFGKIAANPPPAGTVVHVHTNNGHRFTYALENVADYKPDQTNIFDDVLKGRPRLVIQTCTGAFSEWRTMFTFSLKETT